MAFFQVLCFLYFLMIHRSRLVLMRRSRGCSAERLNAPVAVGTALAGGPPHRSQRAEFPHWAPASGSSGKACLRVGMQDSGRWEPSGRQAVHPFPVQAVALTAAPERLQPVPGDLSPER